MSRGPLHRALEPSELAQVSQRTLTQYDTTAQSFWEATKDHDVAQNHAALLERLEGTPPFSILDFGCGPGRDLRHFRSLGHEAVGLDGTASFVEMARRFSGCEVLRQDFLALDLPPARFDGVFANASLFHVPSQEIARVLGALQTTLRPRGVLFVSNPRGEDEEGWSGDRYGCFYTLETWRKIVARAGFDELGHYFRPEGRLREEQRWLATVWRKRERSAG